MSGPIKFGMAYQIRLGAVLDAQTENKRKEIEHLLTQAKPKGMHIDFSLNHYELLDQFFGQPASDNGISLNVYTAGDVAEYKAIKPKLERFVQTKNYKAIKPGSRLYNFLDVYMNGLKPLHSLSFEQVCTALENKSSNKSFDVENGDILELRRKKQ